MDSAASSRAEEQNRWRSPIDFVPLLNDAFEELESLTTQGTDKQWDGNEQLVEVLLGDDPFTTVDALKAAFKEGATLTELTQTPCLCGSDANCSFPHKNEFGDWIAVLHTYTYANALHQCAKRAPIAGTCPCIFHGAAAIYFDRWFNMPLHDCHNIDGRPIRFQQTQMNCSMAL